MTITMDDSLIVSIAQVEEFLKAGGDIEFQGASRKETYTWIEQRMTHFGYFSLKKKEKSILKEYMIKMTGFSDAQMTRLIKRKRTSGKIAIIQGKRHRFARKYTVEDVALLIATDNAHHCLAGKATKAVLKRECATFGKKEFARLKDISPSHIYNLRETKIYRSKAITFTKTNPAPVAIGKRAKPYPEGKPGYLRVDTVHQGDSETEGKGVYHINIVDEVTQWEMLGAAEKISEAYLEPLLRKLLEEFPFSIINFHSDNGSEFINKVVAKLLNKLLVAQTKSRARKCNDNALVESKNGSIVRKHMGYSYLPQSSAPLINEFYQEHFIAYLNYHRPSGFATVTTDKKGKQKKIYNSYLTPYEKLKSVENVQQYLKPGVTLEKLDAIAYQMSDNDCAKAMQKAKAKLFLTIKQTLPF